MLGFCTLIYFCVDYTTNQITTLTSKKYKYCSEKIYLTKAVKVNIQKCILISKNVFLRNSSPKVFNTNFHKLLLQMTHVHVHSQQSRRVLGFQCSTFHFCPGAPLPV